MTRKNFLVLTFFARDQNHNSFYFYYMSNSLLFGKFAAVLPAGGLGKRMGGNIPKQLMLLGGKPVYQYSLETFLKMDEIAEVVMAVPADWKDYFEKEIDASRESRYFAKDSSASLCCFRRYRQAER